MTRLQIIQEALNRANRPDLVSEARLWLNIFLEGQYRNQDWPFAMKTVTLPVVEGALIPDDYLRSRTANLIFGNNRLPILFLTPEQYDYDRMTNVSTGKPRKCYIDQNTRTMHWIQLPDQAYSFEMRYYYMPDMPDPHSPIGDTEVPLWRIDFEVLIQAVYVRALQYDDDARYSAENQYLSELLRTAKLNSPDFRNQTNRIKLGKSYRRRL